MNDQSVLVSVLMTAYNREMYIAEAIQSVLDSTYRNFELIIVDDCSTDKTVEIAKLFELKDNRIKVYVNNKNIGQFANRNKAAQHAQGKYLKYLDSDDILYSVGLEAMVLNMENFPQASYGLEYPERQACRPYPILIDSKEAYIRYFNGDKIFICGPSAAIYRSKEFFEVNGFTGTPFIGDLELSLKLSARFPMIIMQPGLIWWRTHPSQEFAIGNSGIAYTTGNYMVNKLALQSLECPLLDKEKFVLLKKIKRNQINLIVGNFLKSGNLSKTISLIKGTKW